MLRFLLVLILLWSSPAVSVGETTTVPTGWEATGQVSITGIPEPMVEGVAVSPDGEYVAVAVDGLSTGRGVFVFSRGDEKIYSLDLDGFLGARGTPGSLVFLPNGDLVVSAGEHLGVWSPSEKGWRLENKSLAMNYPDVKVLNPLYHPADGMSGTGGGLSAESFPLIGNSTCDILLFSKDLTLQVQERGTPEASIQAIAATINPQCLLVTGDVKGWVYTWKWLDGSLVKGEKFPQRIGTHVYTLHGSPDGSLVAGGGGGTNDILVWEYDGEKRVPTPHRLREHSGWVEQVRFDPTGTLLASKARDGTLVLRRVVRDARNRLEGFEVLATLKVPMGRFAFAPGQVLYVGCLDQGGAVIKTFKPVFADATVSTSTMPPVGGQ